VHCKREHAINVMWVVHVSFVNTHPCPHKGSRTLATRVSAHSNDFETAQQTVATNGGAYLPRCPKHYDAPPISVDAVASTPIPRLDPRGGPNGKRVLVTLALLLSELSIDFGLRSSPSVLLSLCHCPLCSLLTQLLFALVLLFHCALFGSAAFHLGRELLLRLC
jgi:hypothetical protein